MSPLSDMRISISGYRVDVQGDTAHGVFCVTAWLRIPVADGPARLVVTDATYDNDYVRTPDGWRITRMRGLLNGDAPHDTAFFFTGNESGEGFDSILAQ